MIDMIRDRDTHPSTYCCAVDNIPEKDGMFCTIELRRASPAHTQICSSFTLYAPKLPLMLPDLQVKILGKDWHGNGFFSHCGKKFSLDMCREFRFTLSGLFTPTPHLVSRIKSSFSVTRDFRFLLIMQSSGVSLLSHCLYSRSPLAAGFCFVFLPFFILCTQSYSSCFISQFSALPLF